MYHHTKLTWRPGRRLAPPVRRARSVGPTAWSSRPGAPFVGDGGPGPSLGARPHEAMDAALAEYRRVTGTGTAAPDL
jgi:hypothetical protein